MHAAYQKKLSALHISRGVLERIEPTLALLYDHEYKIAEREIALLFVESIKRIRNGEITPKEADEYFTALGILIEPRDELKLSRAVQDILFIGELFHDAGKSLSSEIERTAKAALTVLIGNPIKQTKVPIKIDARPVNSFMRG
ncbi:MAG: hypothetical protein WAP52_01280 [Candidatus Sungiibacteriota bacterium]